MTTKKLLVAFDPKKGNTGSGDFMVVVLRGKEPHLVALKSGKRAAAGLMVYLGREINARDLFAKIVDTGAKIDNAEQTLRTLECYVEKLQEFRIGNILGIETDSGDEFKLVKLADVPPNTDMSKLP